MRWQVLVGGIALALAGCQLSVPRTAKVDAPQGQYVIVSNLENQSRPLGNYETVSVALRGINKGSIRTEQETVSVVLIRRTPEGLERELINCDQRLRPMDPKQDYLLRDGDELILPTTTTAVPAGLERPSLPTVPAETF